MKAILLTDLVDTEDLTNPGYKIYNLAKALAQKGLEVHLVSIFLNKPEKTFGLYCHHPRLQDSFEIDYLTYAYRLNLSIVSEIFGIIKNYGPFDLIHSFGWPVGMAAKTVAGVHNLVWIYDLDLLTSVKCDMKIEENQYIRNLEKHFLTRSNWIMTRNYALKEEIRRLYGITKDVFYLPSFYTPFDGQLLSLPTEKKIILVYTTLHRQNQVKHAMELISKLKAYKNDYNILIIGKGPLYDRLFASIMNSKYDHFTVLRDRFSHKTLLSLKPMIKLFISIDPYETNLALVAEMRQLGIPLFLYKTNSIPGLFNIIPETNSFTLTDNDEFHQKIQKLLRNKTQLEILPWKSVSLTEYSVKQVNFYSTLIERLKK